MDWDAIRVFYHVARAGSFTQAAEELNITQSSISRRIADLEYRIQKKLFIRHSKGLTLTEEGEILYEAARKMFIEIQGAQQTLSERASSTRGKLTITTTEGFTSTVLVHVMMDFLRTYPDISITFACDENLDLLLREADVAIRPKQADQTNLIQIPLVDLEYALYASKSYLEEYGTPQKISDLDHHRLLVFKYPKQSLMYTEPDWFLKTEKKEEESRVPYITTNSVNTLFTLVKSGFGITTFNSKSTVVKNEALIRILPDLIGPKVSLYLVYPTESRTNPLIKLLKDYLINKFTTYG